MRHRTTPRFWTFFADLPESVQDMARHNFDPLQENPAYPLLHFKKSANRGLRGSDLITGR
ncbi:protein of unknown function [Candidatus Nitrospira inopinata]|uniref:Uncharacterized protein n=1 Tax=Candidatus Nitrospira inopinata TaxID=1715989 RepID=A0A0S4KUA9_9BACT|nr:protein of unknown function [Candidatus Nitrospira inopinata]